MKNLTRKELSIAAKYRNLVKAQERAAAQYELADSLAYAIGQLVGDGKAIRISPEGKGIQVTDNYLAAIRNPKRAPKQMPKGWAHACLRQFEIKEVNLAA